MPFLYFLCINPGFGGAWDMLCMIFLIAIFNFYNTPKEYFWSKKFIISCTRLKVSFWPFFNFPKLALFNLSMKFDFFGAKSILLKHIMRMTLRKNIHNTS